MTKSPSDLGNRRYCVLPARVCYDSKLHITTLRVLMAICIHTNGAGVAWPSRETIGRIVSRSKDTVTRHTKRLVNAGYLRKLKPKRYPIPRRTNHHWSTSRYQVLFEGAKTRLPTKEEFMAAKPQVRTDEPTTKPASDNRQGFKGGDLQIPAIAQAFVAGVERMSGQLRIADDNLVEAARLAANGIKPEQILDFSQNMSRQRLESGQTPPLTLKQVAEWAGLS